MKKCQFLIGNVYHYTGWNGCRIKTTCQFLIGNVYHEYDWTINFYCMCQFLIGNVYRNPDMSMHGKRQKRVNSL